MREILFRGKTKKNEWVYGDLIQGENTYIGTKELFNCAIEIVDKNTIGQYTGQKDKNGTKIFEGDIVKVSDKFIDIVVYEFGCFMLENQMYNYEFTYQNFDNIEVIGNMHDNYELLEVAE